MLYTTSYRLHIANYLKEKVEQFNEGQLTEPYNKLLLHQFLDVEYFYEKKPRGMLLYHELGTGKTMTAVACCNRILDSVKGVLFISKLSLHENFRSTIEKFAGRVSEKYKFISLIGSNLQKVVISHITEGIPIAIDEEKIDANDFLIVIDEAHNFFSSITNNSKNAIFLYRLIMRSKCRLLFMTGSPALKESYELAMCFNMLAGDLDDHTLFGENYDNFIRYFIEDTATLMEDTASYKTDLKNMDVFGDRITGLVSFYRPTLEIRKEHFPTKYGMFVVKSHMSPEVYDMYKFYRAIERKEASKGVLSSGIGIPKGSSMSTYRVMTRQTSNFLYPPHASNKYYDQRGNLKYEHNFDDLTDEDFSVDNLKIWSPKLLSLMGILKKHLPINVPDFDGKIDKWSPNLARRSPGIIYSQYLDYGLKIIAKCLEVYGFDLLEKGQRKPHDLLEKGQRTSPSEGGTYAIISGEIDIKEQAEIISAFNDPNNVDGSVLSLLLISATGAEGLDTKRGGHVHIFEPHWHDSRHRQIEGRLNRYDGYADMLPEDRNFCSYIYLSDYPKDVEGVDEFTTDITLFRKAKARQIIINKFLKSIRMNAIDCIIHGEECRVCSPTDESLIINSLEKHLDYGSRCIPMKESSLTAYPFEYEGKEYYYAMEKKEIIIMYYDDLYGRYVELMPGNKDYYGILSYVKSIN